VAEEVLFHDAVDSAIVLVLRLLIFLMLVLS
jgi:hypothetical protein